MRKAILLAIGLCLFFSCKKEHSNKPNTVPKTYSVKFNVSGFTQTIVNSTQKKQVNSLKTADVTIPANYIKLLYYIVFDTAGKVVHKLVQDSTNTSIGQIADNLPAGKYTIVIGAGKSQFGTQNSFANYTYNQLNFAYRSLSYYDYTFTGWQDAFLKTFDITLSGGDINQTVDMDRIVGQLEVQIQDVLPANANSMSISVDKEFGVYYPALGIPEYSTSVSFTNAIPVAAIGTTNYTTDEVICNTTSPFSVTITCYDAAKNILGIATVDNVTCQKNTRTILKGNLFGSNNAFNVTLNYGWASPVLIPFNVKNQTK